MISKIKNTFTKEFLEKAAPFIFIFYFILLALPYVFAPFKPVYLFFLKQPIQLGVRIFASFILILFSLLIYLAYKPKLNFIFFSLSVGIVILSVCSLFISKTNFTFITDNYPNYYLTVSRSSVGLIDIFANLFSSVVDLLFGYSFLFLFPLVIKKKNIRIFLDFVLIFVLIECIYSIIFERNEYIGVLSGSSNTAGYEFDISGTFISKNAFGPFLLLGVITGIILLMSYNLRKGSKLFYIFTTFLICSVGIFSLCKTAMLGIVIFIIPIATFYIIILAKKKPRLTIIGICLIVVIIILLCIFRLNLFNNFVKIFKSAFDDAFIKRSDIWISSLKTMKNWHLILGYPKSTIKYIVLMATNGDVMTPHNGIIKYFMCYGIVGVALLIYCFILYFSKILKIYSIKNLLLGIFLFLSVFVFMITESDVILLSASLLTYSFNIYFSTFISYKTEEHNQIYEIKI